MLNTSYLKSRRKDKNWNQTKVSELIGISLSMYKKIELGTNNTKVSTLIELCKLLEMDANKLLNL